jgi:hypothetical protein
VTDEKIVGLWLKANHWDITGFSRTVADLRSFSEAVTKADREDIALLVEQMGIEGYGTLAIAAAIRAGDRPEKLPETSSPADIRRQANRPWHQDPGY